MNTVSKTLGACAILLTIFSVSRADAQQESDGIYRDLGGVDGIHKIVDVFIPLVANDARIKHQFDDVDMQRLAKMLTEQFCVLSGGPCKYTGKDMRTIHADLGVTDAQFNALAEDLQTAMAQQGISARAQNKLLAKLAPLHDQIVTK